jgi:carbonic anhydrase
MSGIEALLKHNRDYAARFRDGELPARPSRGVAVVTCMDARVMVADLLGLRGGEAHVIRNAGGIVNEETLRSLLISTRLLGTREVAVINHTDCGMLTFTDHEFRESLRRELGRPVDPIPLYTFDDIEENVRWQVEKVRTAPLLPADLNVRGFVYDVRSGALREVTAPAG